MRGCTRRQEEKKKTRVEISRDRVNCVSQTGTQEENRISKTEEKQD